MQDLKFCHCHKLFKDFTSCLAGPCPQWLWWILLSDNVLLYEGDTVSHLLAPPPSAMVAEYAVSTSHTVLLDFIMVFYA